jgi:hypothetical protein
MLYKGVSAAEWKRAFDEIVSHIKNYIKSMSKRIWLDVHEVAHRAMEVHFRYPSVPLTVLVQKIMEEFSCNTAQAEVKNIEENIQISDAAIGVAEAALDLGRLYLMVEKYLSDEDKALFRSINLTDDQQVERLGHKMRKVLDATTSPKKFDYHYCRGSQSQRLAWQAFFSQRQPAAVNAPGNRRFGQRLSN